MRLATLSLIVGVFALLSLSGPTGVAGSEKTADPVPDPMKTLKAVVKNVAKTTRTKGFTLHCDVEVKTHEGDLGEIRSIYRFGERHIYDARVYKGMMHVNSHDAYRTPRGNVMRDPKGTTWRLTHATHVGRLLEQFVTFPHELLEGARKNAEGIEWIPLKDDPAAGAGATPDPAPEGKPDADKPDADKPDADKPDADKRDGHTEVVTREKTPLPRTLRVELSSKLATKQLQKCIDSGVFDKATGCSLTQFLEAIDRDGAEGHYEITLDPAHGRPESLRVVLRTGFNERVDIDRENRPLSEQPHFLFVYNYTFDAWGEAERFVLPADARKILR